MINYSSPRQPTECQANPDLLVPQGQGHPRGHAQGSCFSSFVLITFYHLENASAKKENHGDRTMC